MTVIEFPLRLVSHANMREHWIIKARRVAKVREIMRLEWIAKRDRPKFEGKPMIVRCFRIAPRNLDSDNLSSSFKGIRDEIAKQLGVDDGSKLVKWEYFQHRGRPNEYRVRIEID